MYRLRVLTQPLRWLMIILTVVVLVVSIWQWRMVGCIIFSRTEPVSTDEIAKLESEGLVLGTQAINITAENYHDLRLLQSTVNNDKTLPVMVGNVSGLNARIALCAQYLKTSNRPVIVFLSYATIILVVYWLGRFIWWLRIRKMETYE